MDSDPGLVPELYVPDLTASRQFWCDLVGFAVKYERPEEGFAYLVLGSAHLMLDQAGVDTGCRIPARSGRRPRLWLDGARRSRRDQRC